MFRSFLLMSLLASNITPRPLMQEEYDANGHKRLKADYELVSYVQNFKRIMWEMMQEKYDYLNEEESAKARLLLEQFVRRFVVDLNEILEATKLGKKYPKKTIDDGVRDSTFNIVRYRIKSEFPKIGDSSANEIIFRLRRNIFVTRKRLDQLVEEARLARMKAYEQARIDKKSIGQI